MLYVDQCNISMQFTCIVNHIIINFFGICKNSFAKYLQVFIYISYVLRNVITHCENILSRV